MAESAANEQPKNEDEDPEAADEEEERICRYCLVVYAAQTLSVVSAAVSP